MLSRFEVRLLTKTGDKLKAGLEVGFCTRINLFLMGFGDYFCENYSKTVDIYRSIAGQNDLLMFCGVLVMLLSFLYLRQPVLNFKAVFVYREFVLIINYI